MPLPFESGRKIETMPKRIPEDTKKRAVRLVLDHVDEYPNLTVACQTVAGRLGFGAESLRRCMRQVQAWIPVLQRPLESKLESKQGAGVSSLNLP